jgi:tetratricopeptide (TPR) repeat protein
MAVVERFRYKNWFVLETSQMFEIWIKGDGQAIINIQREADEPLKILPNYHAYGIDKEVFSNTFESVLRPILLGQTCDKEAISECFRFYLRGDKRYETLLLIFSGGRVRILDVFPTISDELFEWFIIFSKLTQQEKGPFKKLIPIGWALNVLNAMFARAGDSGRWEAVFASWVKKYRKEFDENFWEALQILKKFAPALKPSSAHVEVGRLEQLQQWCRYDDDEEISRKLWKMRVTHVLNEIIAAGSPTEMMRVAESHASKYNEDFIASLEALRHESELLDEKTKVELLDILIPMLQRQFKEYKALESYNQGVKAAQSGRHKEAITFFTKSIEASPDHPLPWFGRGTSFAALKRYEEALNDFEDSLRLNPDSGEVWQNKAACMAEMGRMVEAAEAFARCVELLPSVAKPWIGLGKCYLVLERPQEAVEAFRKATDQDPRSADAWNWYGVAYLNLKQLKDARSCFLKALALEPDFPPALHGLQEIKRTLEGESSAVPLISNVIKRSASNLLREAPIRATVSELSRQFGVTTQDGDNGAICSVFVLGSFTSQEECTSYSDVDISVLFREGYLEGRVDSVKHQLARIEDTVAPLNPSHKIRLWPKPVEWYRESPPPEVSANDFLFLVWQLLRKRSAKTSPYLVQSSSTPEDLLELDGWSGLATQVLRDYEIATGVTILGEEIVENLKPVDPLPSQEWEELYLVATRDLASGIAARARGLIAIGESNLAQGCALLLQGDNFIAKAVLRVVYAYELKDERRTLNSYTEIWRYAQSWLGGDDLELASHAYKIKVGGTTRYSGEVDLEEWEKPAIGTIHRLVSFFRARRAELLKAAAYAPQISPTEKFENGLIRYHMRPEDNLPARRFYFERTIPKIIDDLGEQGIDPEILLVFVQEIVKFLEGEMATLKDRVPSEEIWTLPRERSAIGQLERLTWHLFRTLKGQYPITFPRDRIHEETIALLYSDDPFPLAPRLPTGFLADLTCVLLPLADYYREIGLQLHQVTHNTYVTRAETLLRKFILWLEKMAPKEVDLRYGAMLRLAHILGMHQEWQEESSLYQKAIEIAPERYEAYNNLANRYFFLGNPRKCRDLAMRAIELNEDCMQSWGLYFDSHKMKPLRGEMCTARTFCERVLARNHKHPMALACLCRYFLERGDEKQASHFWKRLEKVDPKLDSFSFFRVLPDNIVAWIVDRMRKPTASDSIISRSVDHNVAEGHV